MQLTQRKAGQLNIMEDQFGSLNKGLIVQQGGKTTGALVSATLCGLAGAFQVRNRDSLDTAATLVCFKAVRGGLFVHWLALGA